MMGGPHLRAGKHAVGDREKNQARSCAQIVVVDRLTGFFPHENFDGIGAGHHRGQTCDSYGNSEKRLRLPMLRFSEVPYYDFAAPMHNHRLVIPVSSARLRRQKKPAEKK